MIFLFVSLTLFLFALSVHEAIKTGLKGGRLVMFVVLLPRSLFRSFWSFVLKASFLFNNRDEDDLEEFQASGPASHKTLTPSPNGYHLAARYATAPIRLAQACRLIHQALTGPKARRKDRVDSGLLKQAWESLESCWEEFHHFRSEGGEGDELGSLKTRDMVRFCDGWQIFMYECECELLVLFRVETMLIFLRFPRVLFSFRSLRHSRSSRRSSHQLTGNGQRSSPSVDGLGYLFDLGSQPPRSSTSSRHC